jgi:hypothetical protein
VSVEKLRDWINEGRIGVQTQARIHGGGEWKPLASFPEFEAELRLHSGRTKTEKLADGAFVFGIVSILCGVTALPAMVQATRALVLLRKTGGRKAIFSLAFSSCTLGFAVFTVVSVFNAAQANADAINCVNNLSILGLAVRFCAGDNDDKYPRPDQWCDALLQYAADNKQKKDFREPNGWGRALLSTNGISRVFHCPASRKKLVCGYAFNRKFAGLRDDGGVPSDTVVLFESDAGWNAAGGPEIAAMHHGNSFHVALADGSVQKVRFEEIGQLRWNPATNSPAGPAK